jgi:hypothetical protein
MAEQPAVLERMLRQKAIAEAAAAIEHRRPRFAVIAARGSSDNAARYARSTCSGASGACPWGWPRRRCTRSTTRRCATTTRW